MYKCYTSGFGQYKLCFCSVTDIIELFEYCTLSKACYEYAQLQIYATPHDGNDQPGIWILLHRAQEKGMLHRLRKLRIKITGNIKRYVCKLHGLI